MATDTPFDQTISHFHERGWMRVAQAFDADAAQAMRDAVWSVLSHSGIQRDKPSTWTAERPVHLQRLKSDPVFQAVGNARVIAAIDAILDGKPYAMPKDWGAFFIAFPGKGAWGVATRGWHIDADYTGALRPPAGVRSHALFGDVLPRHGATQILAGSHKLVHRWFRENPPSPGLRGADMRDLLRAHPYIRDLHTDGDRDARIARFMECVEDVDDIPLQVVENTGVAGDVLLLHPLTLHVAAPNIGDQPRFLLSGGVTAEI